MMITTSEGVRSVAWKPRDLSDRPYRRTEASPMPNTPRPDNTAHTVRVPDDLWAAALERAAERGESVSAVVRRALRRYVR